VIVPGLKKAVFIFGDDYGRGFAICRNHAAWEGPQQSGSAVEASALKLAASQRTL
jgi:hypothetical protein